MRPQAPPLEQGRLWAQTSCRLMSPPSGHVARARPTDVARSGRDRSVARGVALGGACGSSWVLFRGPTGAWVSDVTDSSGVALCAHAVRCGSPPSSKLVGPRNLPADEGRNPYRLNRSTGFQAGPSGSLERKLHTNGAAGAGLAARCRNGREESVRCISIAVSGAQTRNSTGSRGLGQPRRQERSAHPGRNGIFPGRDFCVGRAKRRLPRAFGAWKELPRQFHRGPRAQCTVQH